MSQMGFFDADKRLSMLSLKGDPLEAISKLVPWEMFRADIEAVVLTAEESKKSKAGRKPIDALVLFRMLVLQSLYNLSDEEVEYQVRDRMSFTRFLGLGFEASIPDGTTLWLFREKLARVGLIDKLFERFGQHLEAKGYIARGGQMVDATIVAVPRQRNSRDENEQVKAGTTPEDWKKRPSTNRQKDKDARWTKKHGRSLFGYKNHVNADARHKLIRDYTVSDASAHDSQAFDELVNRGNTSRDVYADSAYRSAETERKLKAQGFRSRIHKRGRRNRPLSKAETEANSRKSKVRARIEHVFGAQENAPGGRLVRTIGIVRAKIKIGLQNLVYNIRRLVILERAAAA
jgi:IS5 family transposase